jgi:hypothetical protein
MLNETLINIYGTSASSIKNSYKMKNMFSTQKFNLLNTAELLYIRFLLITDPNSKTKAKLIGGGCKINSL